jgi:predicted phage-related endonuclease
MSNELVLIENNEIVISNEWLNKYKEFKKIQLSMELQEKEFKIALKEKMEELGKTSILLDGFSAVVKKSTTRTTVDSTRLKKELPDIYEEYSKTSDVASSITITVE